MPLTLLHSGLILHLFFFSFAKECVALLLHGAVPSAACSLLPGYSGVTHDERVRRSCDPAGSTCAQFSAELKDLTGPKC